MERIKLKEGIRLAMAISADGNKFLQAGRGGGGGLGEGAGHIWPRLGWPLAP